MYYVDNASGIAQMPALKPVYSTSPTWFTEGGGSTPPTYPGPDTFNMIISEMINVLEAAGMTPKKDSLTQLSEAISKIVSDGIAGLGTAATHNVQTSPTDTTAGAVLLPGAYGWGGVSIATATTSNSDLHHLPGMSFNAVREYVSSDSSVDLIGISGLSSNGNLAEWLAPENGADGTKLAVRNMTTLFTIYSDMNEPPYPVTSVNGETGAVVLTASDVSALPDTYTPPAPDLSAYITTSAADAKYQLKNTASKAVNGWEKDSATGIIRQWGTFSGAYANSSITFPLAFPSTCSNVILTQGPLGDVYDANMGIASMSATKFVTDNWMSGSGTLYWQAVGY
jgi:hypothetical protein